MVLASWSQSLDGESVISSWVVAPAPGVLGIALGDEGEDQMAPVRAQPVACEHCLTSDLTFSKDSRIHN